MLKDRNSTKYFKSICVLLCSCILLFAEGKPETSINIEYGEHDPLNFEEAFTSYDLVPVEYYDNVIIYVKEGHVFAKNKEYEKAIEYFQHAIDYDSTYAFAYNGLANSLIGQNKLKEAETILLKSIKFAPTEAFLYNNLANLYLVMGNRGKAYSYLKDAAQYDPNSSLIMYNLANIYLEKEAYASAIVYYKKSLHLDPGFCDARYNLALAYRGQGLNSLMIAEYKDLVKRCPGHKKGVLNLSAYYLATEKYDLALQLYKQALVLNHDPELYLALGHAYHNLSYVKKEIESYTAAVEIDSTYLPAWKFLATAYKEQGMTVSAINACKKALSIDPDNKDFELLLNKILIEN